MKLPAVTHDYYANVEACYVYGPGLAQSAVSPWDDYAHSATSIAGANGASDGVCVGTERASAAHACV